VTGEGVGGEVKDLEQLIKRHNEYRTQIDRQLDKSEMVKNEGRHLMEEGNFMSHEVWHFTPEGWNTLHNFCPDFCPNLQQ